MEHLMPYCYLAQMILKLTLFYSHLIQFFIWCGWSTIHTQRGHGGGLGVHGLFVVSIECVHNNMPLNRRHTF